MPPRPAKKINLKNDKNIKLTEETKKRWLSFRSLKKDVWPSSTSLFVSMAAPPLNLWSPKTVTATVVLTACHYVSQSLWAIIQKACFFLWQFPLHFNVCAFYSIWNEWFLSQLGFIITEVVKHTLDLKEELIVLYQTGYNRFLAPPRGRTGCRVAAALLAGLWAYQEWVLSIW